MEVCTSRSGPSRGQEGVSDPNPSVAAVSLASSSSQHQKLLLQYFREQNNKT